MNVRQSIRNYRRRRQFARILRSYGYKPTRILVALAMSVDDHNRGHDDA